MTQQEETDRIKHKTVLMERRVQIWDLFLKVNTIILIRDLRNAIFSFLHLASIKLEVFCFNILHKCLTLFCSLVQYCQHIFFIRKGEKNLIQMFLFTLFSDSSFQPTFISFSTFIHSLDFLYSFWNVFIGLFFYTLVLFLILTFGTR